MNELIDCGLLAINKWASWKQTENETQWIESLLKGAKAIAEQLKGALSAMLLFPSINSIFPFIPIAEKKVDEEKKEKNKTFYFSLL